jgi:hypothetical protein
MVSPIRDFCSKICCCTPKEPQEEEDLPYEIHPNAWQETDPIDAPEE